MPIRGRSSSSSSRSRSRSRRLTPYRRQQSTPTLENPTIVQKRQQVEEERLDLELQENALEKERIQAELLEARVRRIKAQKE